MYVELRVRACLLLLGYSRSASPSIIFVLVDCPPAPLLHVLDVRIRAKTERNFFDVKEVSSEFCGCDQDRIAIANIQSKTTVCLGIGKDGQSESWSCLSKCMKGRNR